MHHIISQPIKVGGNEFNVGASIGIATYPEVPTVDKLVQSADMAMYEAKKNGRHFACFYTKHLENKHRNQRTLEHELEQALETNELHAMYQPIISSKTESGLNVESLCRWESHKLGSVSPEKFIPVAEAALLGDSLGRVMLQKGGQLKKLCEQNNIKLGKLSINVFGRQFVDKEFSDRLLRELQEFDIPPELLCIEISEQQMIDNLKDCQEQLIKLRRNGIEIALDDFGTGFSSIMHLKQFPVDVIKLDRALTANIDRNQDNQALCEGIIHMAHRFNMTVTAEGIERQEEYKVLHEMECDEFQGYLFGRPMRDSALLDHWQLDHWQKVGKH
ncbi:MAG: EAL domain-containing protein [Pseudomonadales bacterium]|nr:EAL domain-containing protein [Pseudomonadales bacterium]